jgi:hypothetical protein
VSREQTVRFEKLVELRCRHQLAVKSGTCPSGGLCSQSRGHSFTLVPNSTASETGTALPQGPQLSAGAGAPAISKEEEKAKRPDDTADLTTNFPVNVPLPPVCRWPAEFECPLCFEVKSFSKPSDWTKHVYADLSSFTCTFPGCIEPKPFKRKVDWIRHENELHRHLEWWTCNIDDCRHKCYRRANFVKHLVREHKMKKPSAAWIPESQGRHSEAEPDEIARRADECRQETTKRPDEEPCRFCGHSGSGSWKKLSTHLSRHLEQISLPVLRLVEPRAAEGFPSDAPAAPLAATATWLTSPFDLTMKDASTASGAYNSDYWSLDLPPIRAARPTGPLRYSLPTSALASSSTSSSARIAVPSADLPPVFSHPWTPLLKSVPGGAPYAQPFSAQSFADDADNAARAAVLRTSHHADYPSPRRLMTDDYSDNTARATTIDVALGHGYDHKPADAMHLDQNTMRPFPGTSSSACAEESESGAALDPLGGQQGHDPSSR